MISIKSSTKELKVLQISCFCRYCIFHIIRETSERYPGFPPLIVSPAKQTSTSPDLSFCYFQFYLLSSEKQKHTNPDLPCSLFIGHRRLHLIPVSFNMIKIIDILWQTTKYQSLLVGFPNWHISGCHIQEQVGWGTWQEFICKDIWDFFPW